MFIELHIIQNFAPSNLNRSDTGSPKDCEFGGVRRARVSSQCFKLRYAITSKLIRFLLLHTETNWPHAQSASWIQSLQRWEKRGEMRRKRGGSLKMR